MPSKLISKWAGLVLLLSFLAAALPSNAQATSFPGTGAGTLSNPYKIANCDQLQAIDTNPASNYTLVGDVDCSATIGWNGGNGFVPMGQSTPFSGILDGQNFTISSLYMDSGGVINGIFAATDGATIKNINLRGGSVHGTNDGSNGGLVGYANNTTFNNCTSTMSVIDHRPAGLVGLFVGGSMSNCWFNGVVTSTSGTDGYEGGLVSDTYGGSVITNSWSAGTVSGPYYVGGLVGTMSVGVTLSNSYSTATVIESASGDALGGLVGLPDAGTMTNVFFAGTITHGSASSYGGAVGLNGGSDVYNGVYYDKFLCGCTKGVGTGTDTTSAVNVANATPSYFRGNSTNAPLSAWNFSSVWQTNTADYPTLRTPSAPSDGDGDGITATIENAGPSTDINGDSIADGSETNVTSLVNSQTGTYAALASTCDSNSGVSIAAAPTDSSFSYPLGIMSFTLHCKTNGATASVTQYYFANLSPASLVARKYNSTSKTYQTIPGAVITATTIGGQPAVKVVYSITDGGPLDQDGAANGVIVDPAGLAAATVTAPNTGAGAGQDHTGLVIVLVGLSALGLVLDRRFGNFISTLR